VDEVAGLLAVPEDRARGAREHLLGEDRHHPGLPGRILAWAVDVAERQGGPPQPVQPGVGAQVQLAGELGRAVGGVRFGRVVLGHGQVGERRLAVDAPARGGEDDLADPVPLGGLEQPDGPQHVDLGITHGIGDAAPDADLRGEVHDHRGGAVRERGVEVVAGEVEFEQPHVGVTLEVSDVGQVARREVVHRGGGVASGQQPVEQGGADEARAPRDQNVHPPLRLSPLADGSTGSLRQFVPRERPPRRADGRTLGDAGRDPTGDVGPTRDGEGVRGVLHGT
jgi:hypothetical protein